MKNIASSCWRLLLAAWPLFSKSPHHIFTLWTLRFCITSEIFLPLYPSVWRATEVFALRSAGLNVKPSAAGNNQLKTSEITAMVAAASWDSDMSDPNIYQRERWKALVTSKAAARVQGWLSGDTWRWRLLRILSRPQSHKKVWMFCKILIRANLIIS